jgi:hypothetical protein
MPELSNTVAGRRIGLAYGPDLVLDIDGVHRNDIHQRKHDPNRAGNAPTSRPRSPTLTWPRSADAVHTH